MSIYKGNKLVAGGSIDTHFVRKPAWSQAIELSPVDLTAGYKAPADGMIVGSFYYSGTGRDYFFTLNGTNIMPVLSKKGTNGDIARPLTLSLTVNQGDIIGCAELSASNIELSPSIKFVPFEDSTVSESDVEVVTPELIRNLHDPDWSQAITIPFDQINSGYTAPGRGIIVGWLIATIDKMDITVNDVVIGASTRKDSTWTSYPSIQIPVNKNDVIKVTQDISSKNANMSFVPYKAQ